MKIVFINQTLGIGGAEVLETDLLSQWKKQGHEVKAYVTHTRFQKMLQREGIETEHIDVLIDIIGNWKGLLKAMILFPKAFLIYFNIVQKEKDADVIFLSGFPEKIVVSHLAKYFNVKVVWLEHGPLETVFNKFLYLPKFLYQSALSVPTQIITPSQHTKDHLIDSTQLTEKRVTVIHNGRNIDTQKYLKNKTENNSQQIVCVSRLEPGKGQELLLQAFVKVKKELPKSELIYVGEGDFQIQLEATISKLSISGVQFTGWVPDSLEYVRKSDVCVFPSVWPLEGFGLVMIEAMALGKCVIAFDHAPANEIIRNNKTGLLAKSGDIEDLASVIVKALKDKEMRNTLGNNASKDFQKNFSIQKCADQYLDIFSK